MSSLLVTSYFSNIYVKDKKWWTHENYIKINIKYFIFIDYLYAICWLLTFLSYPISTCYILCSYKII